MTDVFVPTEGGQFVSEKHARIAELVAEYDPKLELAWIPPDRRTDPRDKPFAVIETTQRGTREIVCFADECDERLLQRIYEMDAARHGNILGKMDARNQSILAYNRKRDQEELAEQYEIAQAILKSPKSKYRVGNKVYR